MTIARNWGDRLLSLFQVKPASGQLVPYLDGLRGIAVLFVFVRHCWGLGGQPNLLVNIPFTNSVLNFSPLMAYTSSGIDLFFVLSGFLLAQSWLKADFQGRPRPSLSHYFRQRFLRIAPPYYAALFLILLFFTPGLIKPQNVYSPLGLSAVLAHVLFLQHSYIPAYSSFDIATPLWTLSIEVMFYLALPWLIYLFIRNRWLITLPLSVALTLVWMWLCQYSLDPLVQFLQDRYKDIGYVPFVRYVLSNQFPAYLVDFSVGIMVANIAVRKSLLIDRATWANRLMSKWAGRAYFVIGCAILLYFMNKLGAIFLYYDLWKGNSPLLSDKPDVSYYYYLQAIPMALGYGFVLLGVLLSGSWLKAIFSPLPLRLIGILGYSIYLWHMPLIWLMHSFPLVLSANAYRGEQFELLLLMAGAATFLLSAGFYLTIEKPFILRAKAQPRPIVSEPVLIHEPELIQK